ncbi:hypothetical protein FQN50_004982 [Emmonsiellopsis sp. PD_5]|nr:hypothetical protein FQN50_004982 [Emmonsiellopsis sp. PD_5]
MAPIPPQSNGTKLTLDILKIVVPILLFIAGVIYRELTRDRKGQAANQTPTTTTTTQTSSNQISRSTQTSPPPPVTPPPAAHLAPKNSAASRCFPGTDPSAATPLLPISRLFYCLRENSRLYLGNIKLTICNILLSCRRTTGRAYSTEEFSSRAFHTPETPATASNPPENPARYYKKPSLRNRADEWLGRLANAAQISGYSAKDAVENQDDEE